MIKYTNNPWLRGLAALSVVVAATLLWNANKTPENELQGPTVKANRPKTTVPGPHVAKPKTDPVLENLTGESMAGMSMDERLNALAAYYEKHGFAAAALLLSAFHGDQETYQATKVLALLASQKEPRAVFAYLAENDAYLLSDADVMLALMGAPDELFPIQDASRYASMIPAGGARHQAYNYLSQIMAEPGNLDKIPGMIAAITDRGVLSYLERTLPGALLRANKTDDAIRLIEELGRFGEFTNRNDFVDAGALMAQKGGHTMEGLSELEALNSDKASALFQGYIEEMVKDGEHTYDLLGYTLGRYRDGLDDGALLAIVFKRALAADPGNTIAILREEGIAQSDLDSLVTRNFINFTENHPGEALEYINSQTDPQVRDNLLARYGLTQRETGTDYINAIGAQISDPYVKRTYIMDSITKINAERPQEVYEFIMGYEPSALKNDLIGVNLVPIAMHDIDLGIAMAKEIPDEKSRAISLYSLMRVAENSKQKSAKVTLALDELQKQMKPSQPASETGGGQ